MKELKQYLLYARNEALSLGHCYVGSQHFLLSLLHHHSCFAQLMDQYQLNYLMLRNELKQLFAPQHSLYPMECTLQLEHLFQYDTLDDSIIHFLKEPCSVSSELLIRHGVCGTQLANQYYQQLHR